MNKIGLITIYYGEKPRYLNLFLDSAARNPNFDFFVISDWESIPDYGDNIFYIRLPFNDFNNIAISKGILKRPLKDTYKLCDLKPAWLHILEDIEILSNYDYLGYLDIDQILGKLDNFIYYKKLKRFDIWTISNVLISGAFTIYKNSEKMKLFYRRAECWQQIFNYPQNLAFDETLHMCDLKYLNGVKLISFTQLTEREKRKDIKVCQEDNIVYEWYGETIKYIKGIFADSKGNEYISYHYVKAKKHLLWYYPKWEYLPKSFYINRYGFSLNKIGPLNLIKIILIPQYLSNALKSIMPYFSKLIYHLNHTDLKYIIITIKDKL